MTDTTDEPEEETRDSMTCRKRGITCGKGARKATKDAKKKLLVEFHFNAMEVICEMPHLSCMNVATFCITIVANNIKNGDMYRLKLGCHYATS
ncbi:hypothetical protein HanPI659440_Chr05g0214431 [Helianthus annuus]|nr:hypothetical protein HanPI659440_Chr05g0214431 [Helianthus annuus]